MSPVYFRARAVGDVDADDDGLTAWEETELHTIDGLSDSDGDGASDADELTIYHTNPGMPDSDFDGRQDGDEAANGADPNDPSSYPPKLRSLSRLLKFYHNYSSADLVWSGSWDSAASGQDNFAPAPYLKDLLGILDSKVPFPDTMPRSAGDYENATSYTSWPTILKQRRLFLHRYPAAASEAQMTILLRTRRQLGDGWQPDQLRAATLTIPAGATSSNYIDSMTGFI